jgi:hypothetical protein
MPVIGATRVIAPVVVSTVNRSVVLPSIAVPNMMPVVSSYARSRVAVPKPVGPTVVIAPVVVSIVCRSPLG